MIIFSRRTEFSVFDYKPTGPINYGRPIAHDFSPCGHLAHSDMSCHAQA